MGDLNDQTGRAVRTWTSGLFQGKTANHEPKMILPQACWRHFLASSLFMWLLLEHTVFHRYLRYSKDSKGDWVVNQAGKS